MSGIRDDGHVSWDGPPTKADLGVHVVPLTFGGELSISEHDGDYQLRLEVRGGVFSYPLTALDVWNVRNATSLIVAGRVAEAS